MRKELLKKEFPTLRSGDPGSNPGSGKNFSLKLTTQDLQDC